jgi:hypothetical protein
MFQICGGIKLDSKVHFCLTDSLIVLPISKIYQFGGGEKRKSQGTLTLPTGIGDQKVDITMEIVDAQIPLLIGSNAMVAGKAILNFENKTATFFNEEVEMFKAGTGHFCIDLLSQHVETHINDLGNRHDVVQQIRITTDKVNIKMLKELHHYYGHTSPDRLLKFLENAGKDTKDLKEPLYNIEKSCEACIRTKRRKPKPRSAISRVEDPNVIVSIDLKEWKDKSKKKRYICYLIDMQSLNFGYFH